MTANSSALPLRLNTLGLTPRLVRVMGGGEELVIFGPGKPLAILIYLSMRTERAASRSHLTDLLWADSDLEHARQSLRQAVWQIRHKLGDGALTGDGEQLTLHAPLTADYHEVGAALRDERFEEAVRLYEGDFLAEFGVPGGAGFEHWADRARDRLRSGWMRALDVLARDRRTRGALRESIAFARRLRDADPLQEAPWRFLLETLLLAGDPIGAGIEADALESLLARERREPEPQSIPFLARVRAMPPAAALEARPALTAELIGREGEFRRLTQAWERARAGTGAHLHLSAPAGFGKTRLLRDTERRLRAVGGCVLYLRASPGSRHIAYAFAAELCGALVRLPGASGVGPAVLSTLLALDPSLGAKDQGSPDLSTGAEALRRRTLALADLILALSEESPFALLVDDVHWMDRDSLQVVAGLRSRVAGSQTLVVTSARPFAGRELIEADAEVLAIGPLIESQVEALMMSLGSMPETTWSPVLVHRLHQASRGSPFLVLESLQLALDRGWLSLDARGWACLDPSMIDTELPAGDAIRRRLDRLEPPSRLLLSLLAIAATPLRSGVLAAAAGISEPEAQTLLSALEVGGFISSEMDRWRPAHDELSEVALRELTDEVTRTLERQLGMALEAVPSASSLDRQRGAELLVAAGDGPALATLFLRWLAEARQIRDPRSDVELARALLGGAATSGRLRLLLRARPLHRRLGLATSRQAWGATVVGLLLLAVLGVSLSRHAPRPSRLVVRQAPLAGNQNAIVPSPVIEVQDASGRRVRNADVAVHVEVVGGSGAVLGATTVTARDGLASFDRIALDEKTPSGVALRFGAESLPPVTVSLLDERDLWLKLDHADLNGQSLSPADRVLHLRPGETIQGLISLRYTTVWSAASVLLVAIPTWGDKRTGYVTVGPLATPGRDVISRQPITLKGPAARGTYHLVLAVGAETEGAYIASGTNWKLGRPVWDDGNDLADLTGADIRQADSVGRLRRTWLFERSDRQPAAVAATTIEVQVR